MHYWPFPVNSYSNFLVMVTIPLPKFDVSLPGALDGKLSADGESVTGKLTIFPGVKIDGVAGSQATIGGVSSTVKVCLCRRWRVIKRRANSKQTVGTPASVDCVFARKKYSLRKQRACFRNTTVIWFNYYNLTRFCIYAYVFVEVCVLFFLIFCVCF